jgi:hypothetical protein
VDVASFLSMFPIPWYVSSPTVDLRLDVNKNWDKCWQSFPTWLKVCSQYNVLCFIKSNTDIRPPVEFNVAVLMVHNMFRYLRVSYS